MREGGYPRPTPEGSKEKERYGEEGPWLEAEARDKNPRFGDTVKQK